MRDFVLALGWCHGLTLRKLIVAFEWVLSVTGFRPDGEAVPKDRASSAIHTARRWDGASHGDGALGAVAASVSRSRSAVSDRLGAPKEAKAIGHADAGAPNELSCRYAAPRPMKMDARIHDWNVIIYELMLTFVSYFQRNPRRLLDRVSRRDTRSRAGSPWSVASGRGAVGRWVWASVGSLDGRTPNWDLVSLRDRGCKQPRPPCLCVCMHVMIVQGEAPFFVSHVSHDLDTCLHACKKAPRQTPLLRVACVAR
jgi:hypothetical protein